jgi:hypothetical protein
MDSPLSQYIDMRVYKKNQQLRLLGSSKLGKNNYKIFWKTYTTGKYHLPERNLYKLFCNSLVCYFQKGSIQLEHIPIPYDKIPLATQIYLSHMKKKNVSIQKMNRIDVSRFEPEYPEVKSDALNLYNYCFGTGVDLQIPSWD